MNADLTDAPAEKIEKMHRYRVAAWWTSGLAGIVKTESAPNVIHFTAPAEFRGLEGMWTPEDLLLSAVASCFTATFLVIAKYAKFEYTDLEVETEGIVTRADLGYTFSEIVVRPTLTIALAQERTRALDLLQKAETLCLVSRALTTPRRFETSVNIIEPSSLGKPSTQFSRSSRQASHLFASQYTWRWTMKDRTNVILRPIRPDDESMMVKFHETLSDRTVYFRYFHSVSLKARVTHERLARICFVDQDREIVLVADGNDPKTGQHKILGVGRLNKLPEREEGEIGVLVSDHYQHRGLGTELLRRLVQVAREEKLRRVTAEMLRDNFTVQSMFKKVGFRLRLLADPSSVSAVLDL